MQHSIAQHRWKRGVGHDWMKHGYTCIQYSMTKTILYSQRTARGDTTWSEGRSKSDGGTAHS